MFVIVWKYEGHQFFVIGIDNQVRTFDDKNEAENVASEISKLGGETFVGEIQKEVDTTE